MLLGRLNIVTKRKRCSIQLNELQLSPIQVM